MNNSEIKRLVIGTMWTPRGAPEKWYMLSGLGTRDCYRRDSKIAIRFLKTNKISIGTD